MKGPNKQTLSQWLRLGGFISFAAGVVLSLHHWPVAAALLGGAAAFYLGTKLRA